MTAYSSAYTDGERPHPKCRWHRIGLAIVRHIIERISLKAIFGHNQTVKTFGAIIAVVMAILTLAVLVLPSRVMTQEDSLPELSGTTFLNVPPQELSGPTTEAVLIVKELTTQGPEIHLVGEISYNGNNFPLNLSGTFYKSRLGSPSDKVALGIDASGNFTVLHLAVRRNPPDEALIVNKQANGVVFFLYLLRKDTREATFIETSIVGEEFTNSLTELLQLQRGKGHFVLDFWSRILLNPVKNDK